MECERRNAWIRGCKFEPRYDREPHNGAGLTRIDRMTDGVAETLLSKKTYVRDVCVTCGKTIERGIT